MYRESIMLNPFPIQFLAPLTYLLLRVVLGILCIRVGILLLRGTASSPKQTILGTLLITTGTALVFGMYTQYAALTTLFISALSTLRAHTIPYLTRTSLILMAAISLTLFITGAGPFAFDLPI